MEVNEWLKFSEFAKKVSMTSSPPSLRTIISKRETNGANYFLRKMGRKWLLSPQKFYEWIEKEGKV